ncbi:hypothetical protein HPB51_021121 [Rhipicephalus microplus]|uniref:Uncharacterized protein n=1 Tax=Rhipicephalus microplus TaxID=6941 RepID=A0A9J6DWD7_RHIMP|nr:hypothetical protein HPB51_021121 [Rhipicephalus microplus]
MKQFSWILDIAAAKEVDLKCTLCQTIEDLKERLTSCHRHACQTKRARIKKTGEHCPSYTEQLQHLQQRLPPPLHSPSDVEDSPPTHQLVQAPDEHEMETAPAEDHPDPSTTAREVKKSLEGRRQRPYPKELNKSDTPTTQRRTPPPPTQVEAPPPSPPQQVKIAPPPGIHPPVILPWGTNPVPPTMYHSVGELVKHYLVLATRMPH